MSKILGVSLCALLVSSCGDPVAPPAVTSKAFLVRADLLSKNVSLSAADPTVGIRFTIYNPLAVRATMALAPDSNTDERWVFYLVPVDGGNPTMFAPMERHGPITLDPGEVRVYSTVYMYASAPPGRYHFWGGVLGAWDYSGVLEVLP